MARVSLLDVNVLIALFNPDHAHHTLAHDWFAEDREKGWATCPVTENGFVRILANPASKVVVTQPAELLDRLRRFCASGHHVFWPDEISLRDARLFDHAFISGPRQLTDIYLLGLAVKAGGRLVTCDRSIPLRAVRGATRNNLAVLEDADED